ncbi:copper chaperone PCu(A)C [Myceligenerans cantabricum]
MNRCTTIPRSRALAAVAVAGLTLLPAACTAGSTADPADAATSGADAAALTVEDPWTKAVGDGMTAVFGTLTNTSDHDVHVVSVETDAAESAELHEFVDDGGTPVMQEAEGGFVVPADGSLELEPGGNHLMLIGVTDPLEPGEEVTVVVAAEDGSEVEIAAPVRSFDGADEDYDPGHGEDEGSMDMDMDHSDDGDEGSMDMDHSGHDDAAGSDSGEDM